jgi:hypothetical protein
MTVTVQGSTMMISNETVLAGCTVGLGGLLPVSVKVALNVTE